MRLFVTPEDARREAFYGPLARLRELKAKAGNWACVRADHHRRRAGHPQGMVSPRASPVGAGPLRPGAGAFRGSASKPRVCDHRIYLWRRRMSLGAAWDASPPAGGLAGLALPAPGLPGPCTLRGQPGLLHTARQVNEQYKPHYEHGYSRRGAALREQDARGCPPPPGPGDMPVAWGRCPTRRAHPGPGPRPYRARPTAWAATIRPHRLFGAHESRLFRAWAQLPRKAAAGRPGRAVAPTELGGRGPAFFRHGQGRGITRASTCARPRSIRAPAGGVGVGAFRTDDEPVRLGPRLARQRRPRRPKPP